MMPQPDSTPAPLRDIVGPVELASWPLLWVVVGTVAFLFVALLAFWWFVGRRMKRTAPPDVRALSALQSLREAGLTTYELGIGVSDVLRHFIHEVFGLNAVNQTSIEFLNSLRQSSHFDDRQTRALSEFLNQTDLIKFARADAGGDEVDGLFRTAEEVVCAGKAKLDADRKGKAK